MCSRLIVKNDAWNARSRHAHLPEVPTPSRTMLRMCVFTGTGFSPYAHACGETDARERAGRHQRRGVAYGMYSETRPHNLRKCTLYLVKNALHDDFVVKNSP